MAAAASLETVRAEALFVSDVPDGAVPPASTVRAAVLGSVRRYGPRGCAQLVAAAFDEHPELAAPRMSWVLITLRTVYPVPRSSPPRRPVATVQQIP